MTPHELPPKPNPIKNFVQNLHLNLGGQHVSEINIRLTRDGAPPVKPKITVANEFDENPLYENLFASVMRVASVMSQNNWTADLKAEAPGMEEAVDEFTGNVQTIAKEGNGVPEARNMLDAAIKQIGKSDFFTSIPDGKNKNKQLGTTLRMYFGLAFDTKQNRSSHQIKK